MAAVFNTPVLAVVSQDLFGGGQFRSFTGNSVGNYSGFFAGFLVTGYSFNFEGLSDMGEFQKFIEFSGDPDFSGFFAPMIGLVLGCIVGLPGDIFKKRGDFFEQLLLVVLGSKMIMRISLLDVSGQSLGQQGIGSDGFSFDIEAIEERDGDFYFVCPFFFIASFYRQSADFFWV